jgi:hypothetical protein
MACRQADGILAENRCCPGRARQPGRPGDLGDLGDLGDRHDHLPWHGGPHPAGAGWGPPLSEFYEGRGILPLPAIPGLMHYFVRLSAVIEKSLLADSRGRWKYADRMTNRAMNNKTRPRATIPTSDQFWLAGACWMDR